MLQGRYGFMIGTMIGMRSGFFYSELDFTRVEKMNYEVNFSLQMNTQNSSTRRRDDSTYLLTYLALQPFAVLACLRSVLNRSRSRAFVWQSVIPALLGDASTLSCHLNLGLPRLLCSCGRSKKTLWARSSVFMRITWQAHRILASLIRCTTVRSPYSGL